MPDLMQHFGAWHPGPHYHGTSAELEPGDLIEPGKHPKSYQPWGDEEDAKPREHTYFSPRKSYITEHYGPNVYEVEPQGEYTRDPEYNSNKMFRSRHPLRVVRRVTRDWGLPHEGLLTHFAEWYHGTARRFEPGDLVDPDHPSHYQPDPEGYAFFTPDRGRAHHYAETALAREPYEAGKDSRVYQVEPTGPHFSVDPRGGPQASDRKSVYPLRVVREAGLLAHFAVLAEPLANPYHGTEQFGGNPQWSHTWFHGTRGADPHFHEQYEEGAHEPRMKQAPDERSMTSGWPQPNKLLGVHFTPLHAVGHHFARGVYGSKANPDPKYGWPASRGTPSALVHAQLHMHNPAHFPTEQHLNLAMADWAQRSYPHWHDDKLNSSMQWNYSDSEGTHRDFHARHPYDPKADYAANRDFKRHADKAQQLLQWHPHLPEIIEGFKGHLESQGHHGITYGNEVEGPGGGEGMGEHTYQDVRHISAIATRPSQIETRHVEHYAPPNFGRPEDPPPEPHEIPYEHGARDNEPVDLLDRIGAFHREHGGELPHLAKTAYVPRRHLSLNDSARLVEATRKQGGMSVSLGSGRAPRSGYMVAHSDGSHILDASDFYGPKGPRILRDYVQAHRQDLYHPRAHLGTWHDQDSGKVFLDVAHNIKDPETAIEHARAHDQIAMYDLDRNAEVPTGGTGGLAKAAALRCPLCGLEQTSISATMAHLKSRALKKIKLRAVPDEPDEPDSKTAAHRPPLYHGSLREHPAGTVLTPGDKDPEGSAFSGDYVYAAASPEAARYFASQHDTTPLTNRDVYVHRVEPVGGVEPDDFPAGAEDARFATGNYRAKALRVLDSRRVPGHYAARTAPALYHSGGKDFPGDEEWVHLGTREAAVNRAEGLARGARPPRRACRPGVPAHRVPGRQSLAVD